LRIVLDTNVLVSAFVFPGGAPETVYRLAVEERLELITSRPLLAEFGRVLSEKFDAPRAATEAVAQIASIATVVDPTQEVAVIADDPEDNRVLEAALESRAEVTVSGDRHLLRLKSWQGVRIVSPADFLAEDARHREQRQIPG